MDHLNSFSLKGRPVQFAVVGACYGILARTKSKEERERESRYFVSLRYSCKLTSQLIVYV